MSRPERSDELLSLTQSFFREHLERTCGASAHTVRAYRDSLQLFFSFLARIAGWPAHYPAFKPLSLRLPQPNRAFSRILLNSR